MADLTPQTIVDLGLPTVLSGVRAAAVLAVGLLAAWAASRAVARLAGGHFSPQGVMLARRAALSSIAVLVLLAALRELGFDLSVLLGAAGVLTVAVGFASQTSASNLVSGLFLIVERSFQVGDTIEIGGVQGEVLSIDWMSVKLRTFDNLYVRVPNESVIKATVTNYSHFPLRRFDARFGVASGEEVGRVKTLLLEIAQGNPLVLEEPRPLVQVLGFEPGEVRVQLSVWAVREAYLEMKTQVQADIQAAFEREHVALSTPVRRLHFEGAVPVEVVEAARGPASP